MFSLFTTQRKWYEWLTLASDLYQAWPFHYLWLSKVSENERWRYVSSHWPRPWSAICRKGHRLVFNKIVKHIFGEEYRLSITDVLCGVDTSSSLSGTLSLKRHRFIGIEIPIMNLIRLSDRLMFMIRIFIPIKRRPFSKYRPSYMMPKCWSRDLSWASYQIRKIAGCACAGNDRHVFPATEFKGNR